MQLQRDGDPLVLLDAAVVVGAEVAQLVRLIHGDLLEVEARGVDVRARDHSTVCEAALTDDGEHEGLAAVAGVDLHAGCEGHAGLIGHEATLFGEANGIDDGFTLGAGVV